MTSERGQMANHNFGERAWLVCHDLGCTYEETGGITDGCYCCNATCEMENSERVAHRAAITLARRTTTMRSTPRSKFGVYALRCSIDAEALRSNGASSCTCDVSHQ